MTASQSAQFMTLFLPAEAIPTLIIGKAGKVYVCACHCLRLKPWKCRLWGLDTTDGPAPQSTCVAPSVVGLTDYPAIYQRCAVLLSSFTHVKTCMQCTKCTRQIASHPLML